MQLKTSGVSRRIAVSRPLKRYCARASDRRADLERLEAMPDISELIENLKRHGVAEQTTTSALAQMQSAREAA